MYAEALKPITDTMRKFPGVWDLPDAAGADKIKRLTIEVRTALNLTLPDEYIKFLNLMDTSFMEQIIFWKTKPIMRISQSSTLFLRSTTPAGFA